MILSPVFQIVPVLLKKTEAGFIVFVTDNQPASTERFQNNKGEKCSRN